MCSVSHLICKSVWTARTCNGMKTLRKAGSLASVDGLPPTGRHPAGNTQPFLPHFALNWIKNSYSQKFDKFKPPKRSPIDPISNQLHRCCFGSPPFIIFTVFVSFYSCCCCCCCCCRSCGCSFLSFLCFNQR